MKKLALPLLLIAGPVFAVPFNDLDTRSMAMGGTGVASANPGSAPQFNPALLSNYSSDDKVSIILPNIAVNAVADEDARDAFQNINDDEYLGNIERAVDRINNDDFSAVSDFTTNLRSLNGELRNLNNHPIGVSADGVFSVAVPNAVFGIGVYANTNVVFEATAFIDSCDNEALDSYAEVLGGVNNEAELIAIANAGGQNTFNCSNGRSFTLIDDANPAAPEIVAPTEGTNSLETRFEIAAVVIEEFGVSISREFNIAGKDISFGLTPKFQRVTASMSRPSVNELDDTQFDIRDELEANEREDDSLNIDFGLATSFLNEKLTFGFVAKNLISQDYRVTDKRTGISRTIKIEPQARVGIAWEAPLGLTLTSDLDLTENKALLNGEDTRYLGLGAEWNLLNAIRLRAGTRSNLSNTDDTTFTAGLGFNIFVVHLDLGAQVSDNNAAAALQLGMEF